MKYAKKTVIFRDFFDFSSLEFSEGWFCTKSVFKYQQFAPRDDLIPFLWVYSSSPFCQRGSKLGYFLKHVIGDYVIRDDVIEFPDPEIKIFWSAKHDGMTFDRFLRYRKFARVEIATQESLARVSLKLFPVEKLRPEVTRIDRKWVKSRNFG